MLSGRFRKGGAPLRGTTLAAAQRSAPSQVTKGQQRHDANPGRESPRTGHWTQDHRAIGVPLAPVISSTPRLLTDSIAGHGSAPQGRRAASSDQGSDQQRLIYMAHPHSYADELDDLFG
jgi:hypothetical protein